MLLAVSAAKMLQTGSIKCSTVSLVISVSNCFRLSAGRKKVLGLSATLAGLSGLASAAAPAYWWYMGLRVCSGVAATSMTLAARALATEPIGPSWRGHSEVVTWLFSILGGLIMVLISFLVSQPLVMLTAQSLPISFAVISALACTLCSMQAASLTIVWISLL